MIRLARRVALLLMDIADAIADPILAKLHRSRAGNP
jgi:hypothetical protein